MTAPERRAAPAIWGEDAPPSLWGGLLAAGTLSMAAAVRFWPMPDRVIPAAPAAISAAAIAAVAAEPADAPAGPMAAPAPDGASLPGTLSSAKALPSTDTCPPLFPVAFGVGSDVPDLDPAALERLAAWMLAHPNAMLVVDGHADAAGSAAANFALSQRRARAVAARFAAARLPESRLTLRAFGNYAPLAGASKASPRNRRVALSVSGTTPCSDGEVP